MMGLGKKWIIAAVILIAAGALLFVGALAAVHFDIMELSTQNFLTNTYEFDEDFDKISVDVRTAAVTFVPSKEDGCRIECFEDAEKLSDTAAFRRFPYRGDADVWQQFI